MQPFFHCGGYTDVEPAEWATGQNEVIVVPPKAEHCGGKTPKGGTFSITDETAGTFSAGVDLKKEIGNKLSAQSGYNQNVAITQWVVMDQTQFGNPGPVAGRSRVKGQRASR